MSVLSDESGEAVTILEERPRAEWQLAEEKAGSAEYDAFAAHVLEPARAYAEAVRDAASTRSAARDRARRAPGQG